MPTTPQPNQSELQARFDKWIQQETSKGYDMIKNAKAEEAKQLPTALRELELCPAASRMSDVLLTGWLAVKTSGGWTRRWQARYCVLTTQNFYIFKRQPPSTTKVSSIISPAKAIAVLQGKSPNDVSQDLFGEYRDSVPMNGSAVLINVSDLPNSFQLSYPNRPRLLCRASTKLQAERWSNSIHVASALASSKLSQLPQLKKDIPAFSSMVSTHVDDLVNAYSDRATALKTIFVTPSNSSLGSSSGPSTSISTTSTVAAVNVSYRAPTAVTLSGAHSASDSRLTFVFGDGARLILPVSTLYARTDAVECPAIASGALKGYSDGLFTLSGGSYNADVHLAWKFDESIISSSASPQALAQQLPQLPAARAAGAPAPAAPAPPFSRPVEAALMVLAGAVASLLPVAVPVASVPGAVLLVLVYTLCGVVVAGALCAHRYTKATLAPLATGVSGPVATPPGSSASAKAAFFDIHSVDAAAAPPSSQRLQLVLIRFVARHAPGHTLVLAGERITPIASADGAAGSVSASSAAPSPSSASPHPKYPPLPPFVIATPPDSDADPSIEGPAIEGPAEPSSQRSQTMMLHRVLSNVDPRELIALDNETGHGPDGSPLLRGLARESSTSQASHGKGALDSVTATAYTLDEAASPADDAGLDADDAEHSVSKSVSRSQPAAAPLAAVSSRPHAVSPVEQETVLKTDEHVGDIFAAPWGSWGGADHTPLRVRGPTYLKDQKKIHAQKYIFPVAKAELVGVSRPCAAMVGQSRSYFHRQLQRAAELGRVEDWKLGTPIKYIVVNFMVPGTQFISFIMYFKNPCIHPSPFPEDIAAGVQQAHHASSPHAPIAVYPADSPFEALLNGFVAGDAAHRTARFKYIPRVEEGSWIVRKGVGQTPVIMGNKLTQTYSSDDDRNYIEVAIDVGSSSVAGSVLKLVQSYAKNISIEMNFLFEGQHPDELPEVMLGGCRISNIDLQKVEHFQLDDDEE